MDKHKILTSDVLDVIFHDRNKAYGAYELRKNYDRRAKKALIITMLIICAAISTPIIATYHNKSNTRDIAQQYMDTVIIRNINFENKPKIEVPKIKNPDVTTRDTRISIDIIEAEKFIEKDPTVEIPENAVDGTTDNIGTTTDPSIPYNPTLPLSDEGVTTILPKETEITTTTVEPDIMETEILDVMPEFEGGEDALSKYLEKNLKYPKQAIENGKQGRVIINFVIDKDGEVSSIQVLRPLGDGCDEEAIRVISKMPKWKAGVFKGKNVKVNYQLPIEFSLEN